MILFALTLLAAAPDAAATPTPPTPTPVSAPAPADDLDKVVCHVGEPDTGTRLGAHKECHTKREWAQIAADTRNSLSQATSLKH